MKQIKTASGFECEIDETCLDDMELFDAIAEMQGGNALAMKTVMTKILGESNKAALYAHLRNEKGRVPTAQAANELTEIIGLIGKK